MVEQDKTNILVVDDLPEKLLVYQSILDELGQNIVTARSGEEALGHVLRGDFAVILLDVTMPGMDGFETASLIRRRKRSSHTPIIFLTAFADEMRIAEGYAHGAVDFMLTPVVPEVLRAKVRVFVDLYRMAQQIRRQAEERVALAEERSKREAAEGATRRSNYLAEVSRALSDSLDPDTTARTLVWQAVPFLADLAGVTLAGDPGQPWRTELAWVAPGDREPRGRRVAATEGPHDALRDAVERALACGVSERLDGLDIPYPVAEPPAGRVRSAVVIPLRARGRTLGVLTLGHGPSGRRYEPADLALAEDLASRAAIALDNACLYKEVERADRQKNEFLSMLAHELRNPMAPIRNAAEILRHKIPNEPQVRWARDVIDRQLTHLVRLVDDLLDVSRITRGKIRLQMERVDLAAIVSHAIEASRPAIDQARHQLEVTLPAESIWVQGDPARLAQILTNLLNNAAKYTDPGGRIALTVVPEETQVALHIRDSGIGIPADMLGAIFELFTQVDRSLDRSQGGLGIGLTLVKRLVEMHGGTVEARSDGPGRGSEFTVRLPMLPAEPTGRPGSLTPTSAPRILRPSRVLLVDDNVDAAESLAAILRMAGHETFLAHTGPEALEAAARLHPAAIVLDIGLPGMNGYEVARRLRRDPATASTLLIAVTGYGQEEDRAVAREAGFDHHLIKPVNLADLRRILSALPAAEEALPSAPLPPGSSVPARPDSLTDLG